ncbi:MAG: hypothetical protein GXO18_01535 [Aquificae bacterium]|nr:hypothetical protein [Aquificota bacterium]
MLSVLLLLAMLVGGFSFGQEKKLIFGGVITGSPRDYFDSVKLINRKGLEEVCLCSNPSAQKLKACIRDCIRSFKVTSEQKARLFCHKTPYPSKVVVYGVADMRVEISPQELLITQKNLTGKFDASVILIYGTAFCAILKTTHER